MAKQMEARFGGACERGCGIRIEPGDQILYDGKARHVTCPEAPAPRPQAAEPTQPRLGSLAPALALFDGAREHLKHPKVRLRTDTGREIVLSVAGPNSQVPGALNIADDLGFNDPDRRWYGRIDRDGRWHRGESAPADVRAIVEAFAAEPAKTAAEYGHLTGACCFCARTLTDERSTSVGYGPICAGHYGLPWGS